MENINIYHYVLCPFSRKVRVLLKERGYDFTLHHEPFWERRRAFMKRTPAGETPVVLMGEQVLWGNQAITEYFEELDASKVNEGRSYVTLLQSPNLYDRAVVRRLVEWFDIKFYYEVTRYIVNEKIIKSVSNRGYPNSQAIQIAKTNIAYHMDFIEYTCKHHRYLTAEEVSLADIAAAAQISVVDYAGEVPWRTYPKAKEWYALIKSRPSFKPILADRIPSFPPPVHYSDPDF